MRFRLCAFAGSQGADKTEAEEGGPASWSKPKATGTAREAFRVSIAAPAQNTTSIQNASTATRTHHEARKQTAPLA